MSWMNIWVIHYFAEILWDLIATHLFFCQHKQNSPDKPAFPHTHLFAQWDLTHPCWIIHSSQSRFLIMWPRSCVLCVETERPQLWELSIYLYPSIVQDIFQPKWVNYRKKDDCCGQQNCLSEMNGDTRTVESHLNHVHASSRLYLFHR